MRKLKILVALLCFVWLFPGYGQAATNIKIYLNGSQVNISSGVGPEIINSKVMIPIRVVSEQLGYSVKWEQKTKTVTITQGTSTIKMVVGQKTAIVDGSKVTLDVAPIIKSGTTLVPIRFVAEAFGKNVVWDNQEKAVYIQNKVTQVNGISFSDNKLMIATSGGAKPVVTTLTSPYRIVVDIPNSEFSSLFENTQALDLTKSTAGQIVVDGYPGVEKVRYSLYSNSPSTIRVVVDLTEKMDYKLTSTNAGLITVAISGSSGGSTTTPTVKKTIVIDAGHGNQDSGALGITGKKEKDFNLSLALKIQQLLKKESGIKVIMTRDDDTFLELKERVSVANTAKADLFLSIHANSGPASATGTETYYNRADSKTYANTVHKYLVQAAGLKDRGVKTANFYVIKNTTMPAILLEVGFLTNATDEAALFNETFQNRVAEGVVKGMKEYLGL